MEQNNWFRRHPILTVIIGFILLSIVINIIFSETPNENYSTKDKKLKLIEPETSQMNTQDETEYQTPQSIQSNDYQQETSQETTQQEEETEKTYFIGKSIKIANWNLKTFGDTKASKPDLMNTYSSIINNYNIIFIQEIRDKDGSAFIDLCNLLPDYNCKVSSRAGRSDTYKEQYGVIYKKGIEISNWKDFNPDSQDRWERPPLEVTFDIDEYEVVVYNIHIKPSDARQEINYLDDIVKTSENIIVLGDLNADCSYYNNPSESDFDNWDWLIKDSEDTTVSSTDCAYDRIILNQNSYGEYLNDGIYTTGITSEISDHYLIWVELSLDDVYKSSTKPSDITSPSDEEEDDSDYIVCSSNYYNCGDFSTQLEAQAVYKTCGGLSNDIHDLDRDNDGLACDSLP